MVPLASERFVGPAKATPLPHVVAAVPGNGPALTRPAGNMSLIDAPVSAVSFGFVSVIVRTETPLTGTAAGAKAFVTTGGKTVDEKRGTVTSAEATTKVRFRANRLAIIC
jgi:hypothetical protein